VRVVTRHASGVRGTAVAYVKAFDRFFNLILQVRARDFKCFPRELFRGVTLQQS
jgi:hypothetical protein